MNWNAPRLAEEESSLYLQFIAFDSIIMYFIHKEFYIYQCALCSLKYLGNALRSSQLGPGLWSLRFFPRVMGSGIVEFTIMVLFVEVPSNGVCDSKEVLHVDGVADVGVQVVLEVLKHVHVLVDEVVSSDSWEGEGAVV